MPQIIIDRPPRIQPELPHFQFEIPAPPGKPERNAWQLVQAFLPLLTVSGTLLLIMSQGSARAWYFLPMGLAMALSVVVALQTHRKNKELSRESEAAYAAQLLELRQDMNRYHAAQRRFYDYNYPDEETTRQIASDLKLPSKKKQQDIRSGSRLWERRVGDVDFGVIRLGVGAIRSTVTYHFKEGQGNSDPQARDAIRLDEDSRYVRDAPVVLLLRRPRPTEAAPPEDGDSKDDESQHPSEPVSLPIPITHALGVSGQAEAVHAAVRSWLVHYATFHAPSEAKLYVLGSQRQPWNWLTGEATEEAIRNGTPGDEIQGNTAVILPHCQDDEQKGRFFYFTDGPGRVSTNQISGNENETGEALFLEGLRKILALRQLRLQNTESDQNSDPTIPFLLIVVDLLAQPNSDSILARLEENAAMTLLLQQGAELGAAVIFLVPKPSQVPAGCLSIIEIEPEKTLQNPRRAETQAVSRKPDEAVKYIFRYAEVGVNSQRYVGRANCITTKEEVEPGSSTLKATASPEKQLNDFVRNLDGRGVRKQYGATLASAVPFLEFMGLSSIDQLREHARQQWKESLKPQNANWLRVKVGLMSGNEPRRLTFSASADGVHGMIAGSTGSGKSELLISLIAGLALSYDPAMVNFVLVDYKGGGAFRDFEELPHCVDVITNLQSRGGVGRMFTAIRSELERRMRLVGQGTIVDYNRQRAEGDKPLPFLFIIIDEFAEMLATQGEYRGQLESITRVGRSLGVTLILAAQRPTGVTDQMRSNIKLRICLRVEDAEASREILRRGDAFYLPSGIPGRGYLQVGNDNLDAIQVAYAGNRYAPAKVIWPERRKEAREPLKVYQEIIQSLNKLGHVEQRPAQRAPWPKALPATLTLKDPPQPERDDTFGREREFTPKEYNYAPYLGDESLKSINLGAESEAKDKLILNPFIGRWLSGEGSWKSDLDWRHYAMQPVIGLVDDPDAAELTPLILNLRKGHMAVFGESGSGKSSLIRTLLESLAVTHSPDQVQAYVLDLGGRALTVLAALPHVADVILPDEEGYEDRVGSLLRELDRQIEGRKAAFNNLQAEDLYEYNEKQTSKNQLPAILLIIDNFGEFKDNFQSKSESTTGLLDAFIALARQCKKYGIHILVTIHQLNVLSAALYSLFSERITLRLPDITDYRAIVGSAPQLRETPGRGYIRQERRPLEFQIAMPLGQTLVKAFADYEKLEPGRNKKRISALPRTVSLRQQLSESFEIPQDETFLNCLYEKVQQNWNESIVAEQANWLEAHFGLRSGNEPLRLRFSADHDGVHGIIAGGTGSGKSELLITLIATLALHYDPSILNFVLVDYKGGGAFKPFEKLPHCVNIITNLKKGGAERMFTAIDAEFRRRQELNDASGVKDIVGYRRKGFHLGPKYPPYPHLFIIIDEYAEMIKDNEGFRDRLDSIARLGRSLGVSLILAAQKPTGVTDQMRANIRFRICLRVENEDDSREVIRRPDAAALPGGMPGRGYLQVGSDNLKLIQVAYSGEVENIQQQNPTWWPPDADESLSGEAEPPLFYQVIVKLASVLATKNDDPRRRPRQPWPAALFDQLNLETPLPVSDEQEESDLRAIGLTPQASTYHLNPFVTAWLDDKGKWPGVVWGGSPESQNGIRAMRPVVGLVDNPSEASQFPFRPRLDNAHLILFGDAGWGKTTFLQTLLITLAATHSPEELHIYVLDLGGRNFTTLKGLPHVGDVITPADEAYSERVERLVERLEKLVQERQTLFAAREETNNLYQYNQSNLKAGTSIEPAILVIIDNFAELNENFQSLLETSLVPLLRNCQTYGIHFAVSANGPNVMPGRLYNLFAERMTLRLANEEMYNDIVGRGRGGLPEIAGRAYVRQDRLRLEAQLAQPLDPERRVAAGESAVKTLVQQMDAQKRQKPGAIRVLDKTVSLAQMIAVAADLPATEPDQPMTPTKLVELLKEREIPNTVEAVLGLNADLQPAVFDLQAAGSHFVISGPSLSGKTTALWNWVLSLAVRYPPERVALVLIDPAGRFTQFGRGRALSLEALPHVKAVISEAKELEELAQRVEMECQNPDFPEREIFLLIDDFDDLTELTSLSETAAQLNKIARHYGRNVHFVIAGTAFEGSVALRRTLFSARNGLALRTAEALEKIIITTRKPAALHSGDLIVGRGYQAQAGQIQMMQLAAPYILTHSSEGHSPAHIATMLAEWIDAIQGCYPDPKESWLKNKPSRSDPFLEKVITIVRRNLEQHRAISDSATQSEILAEWFVYHISEKSTATDLVKDQASKLLQMELLDPDRMKQMIRFIESKLSKK